MKTWIPAVLLMSLLGCKNSIRSTNGEYLAPVETQAPNAPDFQPAFKGQTRVSGVKTQTPFEVKTINSGLNHPWGMCFLPNGQLLITEKSGSLRLYNPENQQLSTAILGLPAVVDEAQGGLLDVAIAPDFETSKVIYVSFSEKHNSGTLTAVAKAVFAPDYRKIDRYEVIYRAFPAFDSRLHYGSRIVVDSQGNLFVSTGERSDIRSRPQAQQLNSGLGKIVHITPQGKAVNDNPFLQQAQAQPEIYSYGHRNVQSLAIQPETNTLWEAEFGPRGGDELNIIQKGKNYGWPIITYGIEYSGGKIGEAITQKEGMEQPVYYWDPSVSPSGMTFYSGNQFPEWKNNLLIGTLGGEHLIRLVIENDKVIGEERLLSDLNERFRDVTVDKNGSVYLITDAGKLIQLKAK